MTKRAFSLVAIIALILFPATEAYSQEVGQGEVGFVEVGKHLDILDKLYDRDKIKVSLWGDTLPIFEQGGEEYLLVPADVERKPGKYPVRVRHEGTTLLTRHAKVVERSYSVTRTGREYPSLDLTKDEVRELRRKKRKFSQALSDRSKDRLWQSVFRYPFARMDNVRTSSSFGTKRIYKNKTTVHTGSDFAASPGTPVRAISEGRVLWAAEEELFFEGNAVAVDHGQGIVSIYMHLSEVTVIEGERISQGQMLGRVGQTGHATGPHLHLTIEVWDERVNPIQFIEYFQNKF